MSTPGNLTVHIPTKPYLARYIAVHYGDPVILHNEHLFGVIVLTLLDKKICLHEKLRRKHIMFQSYTATIRCQAPITYLKGWGVDMKDDNIIQLNRYWEDDFNKTLFQFVQINVNPEVRYKGLDNALLAFCKLYNLLIDEHITFDALKKSEYRYRKNLEMKLASNVPSKNEVTPIEIFEAKNNIASNVPSQKALIPPSLFD